MDLPGSYPDDSATPDVHQHNKMHQSRDHHSQTNSSVGLIEPDTDQAHKHGEAKHKHDESKPRTMPEAISGGIFTGEGHDTHQPYAAGASQERTPPYWGDLTTAAGGGIYNTVTGHGSARDDHAEHHHMPPKATGRNESTADSTATGSTTKYPGGGVHNTVTGHGSREEHPAQRQLATRNAPAEAGRDGGIVTGSEAGTTGHKAEDFRTSQYGTTTTDEAAMRTTSTAEPPKTYLGTQRAFPLDRGGTEGHEKPDGLNSRAQESLAVGTCVGAGVSAYEMSQKNTEGARDPHPARTDSPGRIKLAGGGDGEVSGGLVSKLHRRHKDVEDAHPAEKKKHEEHSLKSGKQGGILSIFHKHKGDKRDSDPADDHHVSTKEAPATVAGTVAKESSATDKHHRFDNHHEKDDSHKGVKQGGILSGVFHSHIGKVDDSYDDSYDSSEQSKATKAPPRTAPNTTTNRHTPQPSDLGSPGNSTYNVLASWTPSSIADTRRDDDVPSKDTSRALASNPVTASHHSETSTDRTGLGPDNVLASGTPSGRAEPWRDDGRSKATSRAPVAVSHPSGSSAAKPESCPYNILPSGTPSGIRIDHKDPVHGSSAHRLDAAG